MYNLTSSISFSQHYTHYYSNTSIIFFFFFIPLIFFLLKRRRFSPPLPPGPTPWPILGNIFHVDSSVPPYTAFAAISASYGPLISLKFGSLTAVIASSPAAAREILKTHDKSLSGRHITPATPLADPASSMGFAPDCGEWWRHMRSLSKTELLSVKAMEAKAHVRETKVKELLSHVRRHVQEEVEFGRVCYVTMMNMLTNGVVSVDFMDYEGKGGIGRELKELITTVGELTRVTNLGDVFPVLRGLDVQGLGRKRKEVVGKIVKTWEGILEERRKLGGHNDISTRDFLDVLIQNGMNDDQINQFIMELIFAGTETSSTAIEWAMTALIRSPNSMSKLQAELDSKIGPNNMVKDSDVAHLPYLEACIKEALRLYPPGPLLLPHKALETCHVMGFTVPKGSVVFVNTWAIGRDPNVWDEPMRFEPERFLKNGKDFLGDFEFLPFSAGRRVCLGVPSAVRQIAYVLASLVHTFDWTLPKGMEASEIDMSERLLLTMRKKVPLKLIPKVRNPSVFDQIQNMN